MKFTAQILKKEYPDYISEKRRPKPAPNRLINEGKAVFGTFDDCIETLNILDCKHPIPYMPNFLNRFRAKQWQAFQVDFKEGFLLGAIYSFGYAMANVIVYYDKNAKKLFSIKKFSLVRKTAIVKSLSSGRIENRAGGLYISITNNLKEGKCDIIVEYTKKKKKILTANVTMNEIAMPSVCVMPLGENRPLYSHKALFAANGGILIEGQEHIVTDGKGIIDDHKGYYPRKMHYDWVTGVGREGNAVVGFNLTDNQVTNKIDYNENFLWYKGELHPLPPVKFDKSNKEMWTINDEFGAVKLKFRIQENFKIKLNIGLIKMDYTAPFGEFSGQLTDIDGKKHIINGIFGMGEDKNMTI